MDGGEIGRAQAVQAIAAGLEPQIDMNPVLLKPNSDKTAQIIIHGKALNNQNAKQYHAYKKTAMKAVLKSYHRLGSQYQCIVVEGAGSPAEINLRENDIANMGFAEAVDCPVILIADIEKGGVFAHLVGTLELLSVSERQRVVGFVINRFRGDIALLKSGLTWLEKKTGKPVFAVLPYLHNFYLESEDSLSMTQSSHPKKASFNIVVPQLPKMSNHTDFDPLLLHPNVNLTFIKNSADINHADLIILAGSKSVRDDLAWLKKNNWEHVINQHLRYQGKLLGICGGYQMLGQFIHDPDGIEGVSGSSSGFGFLKVETTLKTNKCLRQVAGRLLFDNASIAGYEIHAGITTGLNLNRPLIKLTKTVEGAISDDNLVAGTYLHGLFDLPSACNALLKWAGHIDKQAIDYSALREKNIDLIADTLEDHFDFISLEQALETQSK